MPRNDKRRILPCWNYKIISLTLPRVDLIPALRVGILLLDLSLGLTTTLLGSRGRSIFCDRTTLYYCISRRFNLRRLLGLLVLSGVSDRCADRLIVQCIDRADDMQILLAQG